MTTIGLSSGVLSKAGYVSSTRVPLSGTRRYRLNACQGEVKIVKRGSEPFVLEDICLGVIAYRVPHRLKIAAKPS